MIKSNTRSITYQILNNDTGEVESKTFSEDITYKKGHMRGWRMYYKDYDEMLEKVIRSSKDVALLHHIKEMITRDFTLVINITKEAKRLGIGRNKLSVFLSRLVEANFLHRTDTGFISNPFMYIPYQGREPKARQDEWAEIFKDGHNGHNKTESTC